MIRVSFSCHTLFNVLTVIDAVCARFIRKLFSHFQKAYPPTNFHKVLKREGAGFLKRIVSIWLIICLLTAPARAYQTVIVDAGHGAPDGGSVGFAGTEEKDLNLSVASLAAVWYQFLGVPYIMTREGNDEIYDSSAVTIRQKKVSDLQNRVKLADEAESPIFLSIHMNASPSKSAHGLQVFYAPTDESDALAACLTVAFSEGLSKIHIKEPKAAPDTVYLMKHLTCPAVILEYGFITNPAEEQYLLKSENQYMLAYLTVCGSIRFINEKG